MILYNSFKKYLHIFCIIISIGIFISPLFIHLRPKFSEKNIKICLPRLRGGDEPHYLIIAASIIKDLDFDLANNYNDGYNKINYHTGRAFRGKAIHHHSYFVHKKTQKEIKWGQVFDWAHKAADKSYRLWPQMKDFNFADYKEYSSHPIGMPLILALFTWPFVDMKIFEATAIFISTIASLIGFIFLYKILFFYSKDKLSSAMVTIFFAFGTPLWHYSRSLFTEPFVFCFTVIALYAFVKMKNYFLTGSFLALNFLINYSTIIFILLFLSYLLIAGKDKFKSSLKLFFPLALILVFQSIYSHFSANRIIKFPMTGMGPFFYWQHLPGILSVSSQRAFRFLFSFREGLFSFSPFIFFAFLGIFAMAEKNKKDAALVLLIFFSYLFCFTASLVDPGYSFSARQLVPFSPLLSIPMIYWYKARKINLLYILFYICLTYSVILNALGSFGYDRVFAKSPEEIFRFFL